MLNMSRSIPMNHDYTQHSKKFNPPPSSLFHAPKLDLGHGFGAINLDRSKCFHFIIEKVSVLDASVQANKRQLSAFHFHTKHHQ